MEPSIANSNFKSNSNSNSQLNLISNSNIDNTNAYTCSNSCSTSTSCSPNDQAQTTTNINYQMKSINRFDHLIAVMFLFCITSSYYLIPFTFLICSCGICIYGIQFNLYTCGIILFIVASTTPTIKWTSNKQKSNELATNLSTKCRDRDRHTMNNMKHITNYSHNRPDAFDGRRATICLNNQIEIEIEIELSFLFVEIFVTHI
jgi:hypothetical protein